MKLTITVDGKVYEVDVEASEPEQPRAAPVIIGASRPAVTPASQPTPPALNGPLGSAADEAKLCRSPVAGVVVKVSAQVDQSIQTNDVLMVLEAMKMETAIAAPVSGKVARIHVNEGDAVHAGQVLVEFQ